MAFSWFSLVRLQGSGVAEIYTAQAQPTASSYAYHIISRSYGIGTPFAKRRFTGTPTQSK